MDTEHLTERYFLERGTEYPTITSGNKLLEEARELVEAIHKFNTNPTDHQLQNAIMYEIGDVGIVLGSIAKRFNITIEFCMELKALKDKGRGKLKYVDGGF